MIPPRSGTLGLLTGMLLAASVAAQPRPLNPAPGSPAPGTPTVPRTGPDISLPTRFTPKFEAWAETKLLMEGLAQSNHRSLGKLLKTRPPDIESWVFARGQALLLAETGNLLLLRPPRNSGRDAWMKLAMEMRDEAGALGKLIGERDLPRSRSALDRVTAACNRCHTTFRIPVRVRPPAEVGERDVRAVLLVPPE